MVVRLPRPLAPVDSSAERQVLSVALIECRNGMFLSQTGDLNNNGNAELSLTHAYTLQQYENYTTVTGDFNGDGNIDLLVVGTNLNASGYSYSSYSLLLGNGDGSFQPPLFEPFSSVLSPSIPVVVGDFNNDGKLDFATGAFEFYSNTQTMALFLGNGDGTFATPSYLFDGGASVLMSGDFNGDGKLDIVAGLPALVPNQPSETFLLFGNGDGTFQPAILSPSLKNFAAQSVADFNNDGKLDLLSSGQVALGNGDGTFTLLPKLPTAVIAVADLNDDGIVDLLTNSPAGVMLGKGDGTFGPLIKLPITGLVADMNGDSRPDIVFVWKGVGVLLNATPRDFSIRSAPGSPTSRTVSAGQSPIFNVVVAPSGPFSGTVDLNCVITPPVTPAPTCLLSSSSVQISTGAPQSVTVTVGTTAAVSAGSVSPATFPPMPLVGTMLLLSSVCLWLRTGKRLPSLLAPVMVLALVSWVACGGSGSSSHTTPGTPAGIYAATITETSGALSHNMKLTVAVH